jgi:hypothetical protein
MFYCFFGVTFGKFVICHSYGTVPNLIAYGRGAESEQRISALIENGNLLLQASIKTSAVSFCDLSHSPSRYSSDDQGQDKVSL